MKSNKINSVNLRGKAKPSQKKSGAITREAIKRGMMGGFGSFSQGNDFGGTDWGSWGANWGQQTGAPPPPSDGWGQGNWQTDHNWDFGGQADWGQQGWGQGTWGDDGAGSQGAKSIIEKPSQSTVSVQTTKTKPAKKTEAEATDPPEKTTSGRPPRRP